MLTLLMFNSCIENDVPYPHMELFITNIEGEGFSMLTPNNQERTIVLQLEETTNIKKVKIDTVSFSPDTTLTTSINLVDTIDLSAPINVTLSFYRDYQWTISATQPIERYFVVQGQIGESVIVDSLKSVYAYVSKDVDTDDIKVKKLKLGPKDITTMDVTLDELSQFDTASYRAVNIKYHNETERWKLYIRHTDIKISIQDYDVRSVSARLTASGKTNNSDYGFRYRVANAEEWTTVERENINVVDGGFETKINGLSQNTDYEFVAYSGTDISVALNAKTEKKLSLPNSNFEEWSFPATFNNKTNKSWFPFAEGGVPFWGTGNQGATTIGDKYNLTTPSNDVYDSNSSTQSAQLQSKYVVVKFAAGNIFTGNFIKVAGTNGIIGMGRPFASRPAALKGWVKYQQGVVDVIGTPPPGVEMVKGETKDQGSIFIALGTWTPEKYGVSKDEPTTLGTTEIPHIVDTRDPNTFFNKNGEDVVAYGELIINETIDNWYEFTIPLDYSTTKTIPTHIIIVGSASRYGDYFTGSSNSVLTLDDLELVYE